MRPVCVLTTDVSVSLLHSTEQIFATMALGPDMVAFEYNFFVVLNVFRLATNNDKSIAGYATVNDAEFIVTAGAECQGF